MNISPSFTHFMAPVIAAAATVLENGRQLNAPVEARVALIAVARIIEADMLAELTPGPPDELMRQPVERTRGEIEQIYTAKWAKH